MQMILSYGALSSMWQQLVSWCFKPSQPQRITSLSLSLYVYVPTGFKSETVV